MTATNNKNKLEQLFSSKKINRYLPVLLILIAVFVAYFLQVTAPSAAVKPESEQIINVNVIDVEPQPFTPTYKAYGRVIVKNKLTLTAQVEGRLDHLAQNVIEGGVIEIGDHVFQQDSSELSALVAQRQAEVKIATAQLSLELGQQRIAEKDYQMMQKDFNEAEWQLDLALLLRKPQLIQAKAQLNIAHSALKIANRDLNQSQWHSDKRYIVESKQVSTGDYLTKGNEIAKLIDTDELRVPIYLPRELAAKTHIGQSISLYQPETQLRVAAKVSHILPMLDDKVQLQKVFAEYRPAADESNRLIIGDFVEATLQYTPIPNTLSVPLAAIDNNQLWLVTANSTLKALPVTVIDQDDTHAVIINSLSKSEQIISNKIHLPQPNLTVNIVEVL